MNDEHATPMPVKKGKMSSLLYEVTKGSVVGAAVTVAATPGLYATTEKMANRPFILRRCHTPFKPALAAVVPVTAWTYVTRNYCMELMEYNNLKYSEFNQELLAAAVGGGSAGGLYSVVADGLGQTKQALVADNVSPSKLTNRYLVSRIAKANGYRSLLRGSLANAAKEGSFAVGFFSLAPEASRLLQEQGHVSKNRADLACSAMVGGCVGFFTVPLQGLRYEKQKDLTIKHRPQSYWKNVKEVLGDGDFHSKMVNTRGFFKGGASRSATLAVGTFVCVKTNQCFSDIESSYSQRP